MMLSRQILQQIRRLHLQARRAVEDPLGGIYRSVFKGTGLAFEEVREYQPGDDIRAIDWNVTARIGHPFVKLYREERERTMLLLLDVSSSMAFESTGMCKREAASEIAALLALCAVANNDRVGLLLCSNRVEHYVPPRKGTRHALRLLRDVFMKQPSRAPTRLAAGFDFLNKVLHRRALIFVLSDFLDEGFEKAMQRAARRHELIAIALEDPLEAGLPDVGLVQVEDLETGDWGVVDTSDPALHAAWRAERARRAALFQKWTRAHEIEVLKLQADAQYLAPMLRYFRQREHRIRTP